MTFQIFRHFFLFSCSSVSIDGVVLVVMETTARWRVQLGVFQGERRKLSVALGFFRVFDQNILVSCSAFPVFFSFSFPLRHIFWVGRKGKRTSSATLPLALRRPQWVSSLSLVCFVCTQFFGNKGSLAPPPFDSDRPFNLRILFRPVLPPIRHERKFI